MRIQLPCLSPWGRGSPSTPSAHPQSNGAALSPGEGRASTCVRVFSHNAERWRSGGWTVPAPGILATDARHWVGQTPDSPALRRDECVAHVQDAHVRVALHVLLPVHVVVLDHICRTKGTG